MKKVFFGLFIATTLVASAYSYGCQHRQHIRNVKPLVEIAPKWSLHIPKLDSFWGNDILNDPWLAFDHIADDAFNVFRPTQREPQRETTQCKSPTVETPLNDEDVRSGQEGEWTPMAAENDDWSEETELLRRQEWEKKLQDDIQKENQRREEWYSEKKAKELREQEERQRIILQERQRQHDLLRKQEEEVQWSEEQMRLRRQEMDAKMKREQWLNQKRREEEQRIVEERVRKQTQEALKNQEELRKREAERQEQIRREQFLQEKRQEEHRRQVQEQRRREEQQAEERMRILEEQQQAKQRELEDKVRRQQEMVRQEQERQREEIRNQEQQNSARAQTHCSTHQCHNNVHNDFKQNTSPHSQGFESIIYQMTLSRYYPADLSVKVQNGVLRIEGSHICNCEEDCFMREFERKTTLPVGVDTDSLSASLDSEGHFKVTGVQYSHPIQQSDIDVPVLAVHMPRQMPSSSTHCPEKKTTFKLSKIDPATGTSHKRNAYKFERRRSHYEDDGVTIEVADDYL